MRGGALLALVLAGSCVGQSTDRDLDAGSEPPWGGGLRPGPYAVGFRSRPLERPGADGEVRRLTLSVWYPAAGPAGRPVSLRQLLELALAEGQIEEAAGLGPGRALAAAMTGDSMALPLEDARSALGLPTWATWDPEPADGSFPLALWSARHATVFAQAPMSEILASHGFVVATVWSSDPPLAFVWEDHPDSVKRATIDTHTGDLEWAIESVSVDGFVDTRRIMVLAWSYGGQSAALLQERVDGVRGVVSLDANVVPARPEEELRLRRPLVWLLGADTAGRGLGSAEALEAPALLVRFPELAHGSFNAMEGFLPATLGSEAYFPWSRGGTAALSGYPVLVDVVLDAATSLLDEPDRPLAELGVDAGRIAEGRLGLEVRVVSPAGRAPRPPG